MAQTRMRLDELLVQRGFYGTVEEALRACLAGVVRTGTEVIDKPGTLVRGDIELSVVDRKHYVGRGGFKLDGALDTFSHVVDVAGKRCVDIGASTGGFTDCLLQHGAASVAAVDVGYGQLAWSLQNDQRVTVFDRTNIKSVDPVDIGGPFQIAVADLSFIGLASVLEPIHKLLEADGFLIALVKPQFEAQRGEVGEGGIVADEEVQIASIERVLDASRETNLIPCGLCVSPLPGREGNIEFFLLLANDSGFQDGSRTESGTDIASRDGIIDVAAVVRDAHDRFGGC